MYPYIYIALPSYGLFAFTGFVVAIVLAYYRSIRFGVNSADFFIGILYFGVSCICGSKILFIITRISEFSKRTFLRDLSLLITKSGLVYYGGLFGGLLGIKIFVVIHSQYSWKQISRLIAPAIPLFHSLGRIGCWMAGCCYGIKLDKVLPVIGIKIERLPVQLIEALAEGILFLAILYREEQNAESNLLKMYLLLYSIFRFIIEFFRGDILRGIYWNLSVSQWISISIWIYFCIDKAAKKK